MANSLSKPVVIMASGGLPVAQVAASAKTGIPATVVTSLGMGITLLATGKPMVLWNADGTEYVPG
jgi:hypothetical protein